MRLLTIAIVLVLALGGAACGGGDEASDDTDTVVTETTTDETTTEETTDETTDGAGALASDECLELVGAAAALGQAFATGGSGADDVSGVLDEYADRVPDEIRADIEVLAAAYSEYADALADAGIEPGETAGPDDIAALQSAVASIDQQEVTEASESVSAWANANC